MSDAKNNERSTNKISLIVLTFLAIAIETVFFLPSISNARQTFLVQNQAEFLLPTDWSLLLGFILVPIIYCSFASIIIHPKTLINPFLVQIGTLALVIMLTLINLSNGQSILTAQFVAVLAIMIIFSALFVIIVGIFQWFTVLWVIRLNYEDSDRVSYSVDMKPKEILHRLGSSFLDDWTFSRECDIGDIWVLERNDHGRCLLLEVGASSKDENKSILATVAFEKDDISISESPSSSNLRNIIVGDIETRLGIKFKENTTDLDDPVSRLALDNVKELARSRIEVTWTFLRELPRPFKVMMGITISLLLGLSITFFNFNGQHYINSDTFVSTIVILLIALLVEIGIPLRDELQKRKREELEF